MLTGSRRVGRLVTLVLIGLLGSTGCGSSASAPHRLPALSPTSSPTSSSATTASGATASPRTPTPGAKAAELAAATSVVNRYFSIANNLRNHMDSTALSVLFASNCPCQAQARAVRIAADKDEHYIDHATINALRASTEGTDKAGVLADYNSASGGLVDEHGKRLTVTKARRVRWLFSLQRTASTWLITNIQDIS